MLHSLDVNAQHTCCGILQVSPSSNKRARIPSDGHGGDAEDASEDANEDDASLMLKKSQRRIEEQDGEIKKLQEEVKRLKKALQDEKSKEKVVTAGGAGGAAPAGTSLQQAKAQATKLKTMAYRAIKSQMKWKPSCKHGTKPRWSWDALCDEATFRAFRGLEPTEKAKGGKMTTEDFTDLLGHGSITTSIRFGYLSLAGESVNITYANGSLKITGAYGL
ncbi:hypothetical protein NFJ02_15g21050 [Pycnococcus provasolii]